MPINQLLTPENGAKPGSTRSVPTEISAEERQRRAHALESMAVLDTPPEAGFDALTRLAANVCGTSIASVSLIDGERVWFKSIHGLNITSVDSRQSFACEAANSKRLLEVSDARLDPRFSHNPLVTAQSGVVFYAGAPIVFEGVGIGAVCVLDYAARELSQQALNALTEIANIATAMLRARIETFKFFSSTR